MHVGDRAGAMGVLDALFPAGKSTVAGRVTLDRHGAISLATQIASVRAPLPGSGGLVATAALAVSSYVAPKLCS